MEQSSGEHQGYIPDINEIINKINESTYDYTDVSIYIKHLFYDDLKDKRGFTQVNLLVLLDFLLEEEKRKKEKKKYEEDNNISPSNIYLITSLEPPHKSYPIKYVKYGFLNQDFKNAKKEDSKFFKKNESIINNFKQKIKNIKITNMPNIKTIQHIIDALREKNSTYQINKNVDYRIRDDIYYTYVLIYNYLLNPPPVNTTGGKRKRKTKRKRLNKKKRKSARRKR